MSAPGALRDEGNGRYSLAGAVVLGSVAQLREHALRAFGGSVGAIEVDLHAVERVDSGALALLVDWLSWARAAGRGMKFTALPAALLALARLSDVEDLLTGR